MDKLILAQGAAHTDPSKLARIVQLVNKEHNQLDRYDPSKESVAVCDMIADKFDVTTIGYSQMAELHNFSYVTEEKYDGYSYINQDGRFFSKRLSQAVGNEGMPIEKTGHVPHIANILCRVYEQCGCDLHGELYVPGGISDDVTAILGCDEDEANRRTAEIFEKYGTQKVLHYRLLDIRRYHNIDITNQPYYVRRALLMHVYWEYIVPLDICHYIGPARIYGGDPRTAFARIVHCGGEGIILKRTDALYIPGKKPANNWIKGKKKITLDVVITGFNDGTGKNKSLFGSIKFGLHFDDGFKECGNCSSGLNDATRMKIATDPDSYINTVMEITAIQESVKSFRNAVFIRLRDDKGPEECTPLNIKINDNLIV